MARLRIDTVGTVKGTANPITLSTATTTTASWTSAPAHMPAVVSPTILVITVQPNTSTAEIIHVTAYTAGASTATVVRAAEGPGTARIHTKKPWIHGPTATDFGGMSLSVNTGLPKSSGFVPITVPLQQLARPTGLLQPTPPLTGFRFTGTYHTINLGSYAFADIGYQPWCVGRDRNIWVLTDSTGTYAVIKATPLGQVLAHFKFSGTTIRGGSTIVSGPDSHLYCITFAGTVGTEHLGTIRRISLTGTITTTGVAIYSTSSLLVGADGNLWASTRVTHKIFRVKLPGYTKTVFTLPTVYTGTDTPQGMCAGPDGSIWVSSAHSSAATGATNQAQLWRVDPTTGSAQRILLSKKGVTAQAMCVGPDGNLWVVCPTAAASTVKAQMLRMTAAGATQTYFTMGFKGGLGWPVAGAGGDVWVCSSHTTTVATGNKKLFLVSVLGTVTGFSIPIYGDNLLLASDSSFWMARTGVGQIVVVPFLVLTGGLVVTSPTGVTTSNVALRSGGSYITKMAAHTTTKVATSGTAFQPTATKDTEIFFNVTTAGTVKITYGPTASPATALLATASMPVGATFTKRIPAGWYLKITLTGAAISTVKIQTV